VAAVPVQAADRVDDVGAPEAPGCLAQRGRISARGHAGTARSAADVDAELGEGALVDQQGEPLARGQLVLGVLALDPFGAAAQLRLLAPLVQVLDE
jgi:hypothetical protein